MPQNKAIPTLGEQFVSVRGAVVAPVHPRIEEDPLVASINIDNLPAAKSEFMLVGVPKTETERPLLFVPCAAVVVTFPAECTRRLEIDELVLGLRR
jgi:hypothetical protein